MFSKLSLSLAALALSAAASTAHANHIPTSTDEARALAGSIVQDPSASPALPTAVSSTDEARAAAGAGIAANRKPGAGSLVLAGIPGHHSPASP
jgi:hypothetical protein